MKAFLVGLIFLIATALLAGIGILLFPFFLLLAFALRMLAMGALVILAVWLLGTFIIFFWEKVMKR